MTFLDPDNWRIVRDVDVPAYIRRPLHGGRMPRVVRLGHDGATLERFPAVELGHMFYRPGAQPGPAAITAVSVNPKEKDT